jgi:hypothetical protein
VFGVAKAGQRRGALHRLTTLRDDRVEAWIGSRPTPSIILVGWMNWMVFTLTMMVVGWITVYSLGIFGRLVRRFIFIGLGLTWAGMIPWMRRRVVRVRNQRLQTLVRAAAIRESVAIDDWEALRAQPDGAIVSLVGWVSGHAQLSGTVAGEPCVGIALDCYHNYPGVFESLHDFDLLDENGRSVTVRVEGGRLLGEPQHRIYGTDESRLLIGTLELPATAATTGDAYVLRDGEPVMVIGFKSTGPSELNPRVPGPSVIASSATRPLLIYPIRAERRVPDFDVDIDVPG